MNRIVRALLTDRRGASAAEFAIVLPLMLILLFGIIDAGRYAYSFNRAEKATQVGARFAVVTTPVAPGLAAFDFTTTGVAAGDPILRGTYGPLTCTSTACACDPGGVCPTGTGAPVGAMPELLARMKAIDPEIVDTNVRVTYTASGLGFAGDPTGMNISPLVTVSLSGMTFKPVTSLLLASITLNSARTTLTAEDSIGSQSN